MNKIINSKLLSQDFLTFSHIMSLIQGSFVSESYIITHTHTVKILRGAAIRGGCQVG